MNKYRLLGASCLLLATLVLVACGGAVPPAPEQPASVTITDDIGNEVTLSGPVERIVSLAPSNTEIALSLIHI